MTLVQLRHLAELARTGSFNRAADALHITQPALSRSIAALEDELGQRLFDRIGRRTTPTAYGRQVFERANRLLTEADDLAASGRSLASGSRGVLRIGMGSGAGALLAVPMMEDFTRKHPHMQLEIARASTGLLVHALRDSKLDAIMVDIRPLPPANDLEVKVMAQMSSAFLCRAGHPLLMRGQVTFNEVKRFPVASIPLAEEVCREFVERYGSDADPQQFVTLRCDDIASLVTVVRNTDTVLLSIRECAPQLAEIDIRPRLVIQARLGMVTLRHRQPLPALPFALEFALSHLRSLGADV